MEMRSRLVTSFSVCNATIDRKWIFTINHIMKIANDLHLPNEHVQNAIAELRLES